MSSFYDDASLVVIPSGYKTSKIYAEKPTDGSGDLTFTRASGATRVASNGLIEKVRTNLILQSQTFDNASWTKSNVTVTANSTTAPDGTTTADTILAPLASTSAIYQAISSEGILTMSVYAKANTSNFIYIAIFDFSPAVDYVAIFDLSNGTYVGNGGLSSVDSYSIVSAGNGWYRISATKNVGASGSHNYILGVTNGNSTTPLANTSVYVWGAQVEVSDFGATDYIPTTTAAVSVGPVSNVPRLDYLGSTCPRLLLEPQRQNLVTFSESFDNAAWTKEQVTITANATTSPDGTINADKVIANATAGDKYVVQIFTVGIGDAFTTSAYFKSSEYTYAFIRFGGLVSNPYVIYNLATQSVVTTSGLTSSSITSVGNGWYRITATVTSTTTTIAPVLMVIPSTGYTLGADNIPEFTGNGTSGGFIWGGQLEAGAYATSYIPTLSASVTRVADAASKTGISSLIGQTEGTMFLDVNLDTDGSTFRVLLNLKGVNPADYITINTFQTTGNIYADINNTQVLIVSSVNNGRCRVALAYKNNDVAFYINGVLIGTSNSATIPATSAIGFNDPTTSGVQRASNVNKFFLFKTRLTNAQLAELTTL
jgi:hypothetical protein